MAEQETQPIESMEALAAKAQAGGKAIALAGHSSKLIIDTDVWRFATGLCQAGMVPKGLAPKAGAVCGIIQAGAEIGFPPMHALSALTFINGRLGIMGEASRGLVRARGAIKEGEAIKLSVEGKTPTKLSEWPDGTKGVAWCWPRGAKEPARYEFSVADAKRAGLWNNKDGPWKTYPNRMLMNRAWGFLFRDHFSELFSGLWTTEELRDIDPVAAARDVSPQPAHAGPGPGEQDPALAISAEVVPPEQKLPEDVKAPTEEEYLSALFGIEEAVSEASLNTLADAHSKRDWKPEQRAAIKAAVDVQAAKLKEPVDPAPCTHPDGFAPSSENMERHCVHCNEAEQQSL